MLYVARSHSCFVVSLSRLMSTRDGGGGGGETVTARRCSFGRNSRLMVFFYRCSPSPSTGETDKCAAWHHIFKSKSGWVLMALWFFNSFPSQLIVLRFKKVIISLSSTLVLLGTRPPPPPPPVYSSFPTLCGKLFFTVLSKANTRHTIGGISVGEEWG